MPGLLVPSPNYSTPLFPTSINHTRINLVHLQNWPQPSCRNSPSIMFNRYYQRAKPFAHSLCRNLFNMTKMKSSSVQVLYDLCKETFTPSTTHPVSSQAIDKLSSILDTIAPSDVGLEEQKQEEDRGHGPFGLNMFNRVDRWAKPLTYVDVHENNKFTIGPTYGEVGLTTDFIIHGRETWFKMCIFCFPTSSVIPLHDHPGMTVLSKVLYGSLHVKAYDWVEPACILKSKGTGHSSVRLAKLAVDKVLTAPCSTSVLYPKHGGNLHCFTAVTPCAVLDVLAPPYAEGAGRKCTYYRDYPYSSFGTGGEVNDGKEEDYAWLAEIETPDDLYMCSGRYRGPTIQT